VTTPAEPNRPLDPQKLIRIASLAREVLEETRRMGPEQASADQLAKLYGEVNKALVDSLPDELAEELAGMGLDQAFSDGATTDEARITYSGLIGWLSGLFQGLQAAAIQNGQLPEVASDAKQEPSEGAEKPEGYL